MINQLNQIVAILKGTCCPARPRVGELNDDTFDIPSCRTFSLGVTEGSPTFTDDAGTTVTLQAGMTLTFGNGDGAAKLKEGASIACDASSRITYWYEV